MCSVHCITDRVGGSSVILCQLTTQFYFRRQFVLNNSVFVFVDIIFIVNLICLRIKGDSLRTDTHNLPVVDVVMVSKFQLLLNLDIEPQSRAFKAAR